jgi:hypothetical protein
MTTFALPKPGGVARLLAMLFARPVQAAVEKQAAAGSGTPFVVGAYQDDAGKIVALALFDLPLAAYTGAALTMIPAGTAETDIRAGALTGSIEENVPEVLNICVGFFGTASTPPIRLARVCPGSDLPAEITALLESGTSRLDLRLEIAGYGDGSLTLLAA